MSYRVRTQAFSGPFDLLLTLVSRQKVAIGSISVSEVADQYLAEVARMGEMDLDVASDFVLVASTLLDIKAASLVPKETRKVDDDLDEDDLEGLTPDEAREVLVDRLMTYKQFRSAGAALGSRADAEALMEPRTAGPDPEFENLMPDYLEGVTLRSIAVIAADILAKRERFLLDAEHVAPRREPIALTVAAVDRITRLKGHVTFTDLLDGALTPENVVATFLAILELCKRGSVLLAQEDNFAEIDIVRVPDAPAFELETDELTLIEEIDYDA